LRIAGGGAADPPSDAARDAVSSRPMHLPELPISPALPSLRAALAPDGGAAVLYAPPGAGKSTVVPLALLDEPWARGKRIVMLEPRRIAARAVARRMAATLGERVGERVGQRMRLDTRVSAATRIEVITEGVLTRMLQHDPSLDGIALVIFDEFHERSLQADLGLALTLDARDGLAPALRVLVMSATLDAAPVAALLGDAAIVEAQGRMHPVETRYVGTGLPPMPTVRSSASFGAAIARRGTEPAAELTVARIVRRALEETEGDVLVFLPGAPEIRRVEALLAEQAPATIRIAPLFGDLDATSQDAALMPSAGGVRKIVLATNIAETSLTIEGVRVVVDSGLARHAVFDPATGMSRLETQRVSRASADQRRGRAGRTAPGVCYRAWSEAAQRSLAPATPPEILRADLAALALELASWGVADPTMLRWLDPPPAAALDSARDLLRRLGALDRAGRITPHGRAMSGTAVHPRLAHMLLRAREIGAVRLAAQLAALLSERDLLRGGGMERDADVLSRLALLAGDERRSTETASSGGPKPDRGALHRAQRFARELERKFRPSGDAALPEPPLDRHDDDALAGLLLAFAYPDRIGRRRPGDEARYTLLHGRGAVLPGAQSLGREELIVAVDLDDRDRDARILLAARLGKSDIETYFAEDLEHAESVEWSAREQAVVARRITRLGGLTIDEKPLPRICAAAADAAMLQGMRELGLAALPWTDEARELQARVAFACGLGLAETAEWPALDDASLHAELDRWLAPWVAGMTRREHLARLPLVKALEARLGRARLARLDALAPARLEVPSGSQIRIDYRGDNAPRVAVRLQEVFGLDESPRIGGGRVPLTFELLSPARRPVQVTRDLASFWRGAYQEVRKDLRGRYPKHYWPEDPLVAEPTRGVKRRRT
jgi:ATP-dependent helicase HrpB